MFFVGLISADEPLCHAISEQLRQGGGDMHLAVFASLENALGAWSDALPPLILWDAQTAAANDELSAFFVSRLTTMRPEPLLLVVGAPPAPVAAWGVTEAFNRPLRLGFLLGRIQFYQRQLQQAPDSTLILGPWIIKPRARSATHRENGETVKLTDKESALLEYLWAAAAPVPRDELLASVWGYEADLDTHTLETHIYRLRRKLMPPSYEGEDLFIAEGSGYHINPSWRGGAS